MKKWLLSVGALLLAVCMIAGCAAASGNGGAQKNYSAIEILEAIKEAYGDDFLPNMDMGDEYLLNAFELSAADLEEYVLQMPAISVNQDVVLIIKASEGQGEAIEKTLLKIQKERYIDGGMFYPANLPKAKASKVLRSGDYVAFLMLGAVNDSLDATEEERLTFATEQVQKGVDVWNKLFE